VEETAFLRMVEMHIMMVFLRGEDLLLMLFPRSNYPPTLDFASGSKRYNAPL
jgi:hypothetical protein